MNMVPTHPVAAIWKGFLPLQDILARWPCRSVPPIPSQWLPPSARSRMQTITEITMIITITITTIVTITSETRGHEARLHTHTHLLLHKFPHALPLSWNALQGGQNETWCLQQIRYVPDIIIQYNIIHLLLSQSQLRNASGATAMCGTCVLGPGRHSSRDRGAFGSAMAVLQRRLRTLRQQLAAAEAQQRKEVRSGVRQGDSPMIDSFGFVYANCWELFGILRMTFMASDWFITFQMNRCIPLFGHSKIVKVRLVVDDCCGWSMGCGWITEITEGWCLGAWGSTVWQWLLVKGCIPGWVCGRCLGDT